MNNSRFNKILLIAGIYLSCHGVVSAQDTLTVADTVAVSDSLSTDSTSFSKVAKQKKPDIDEPVKYKAKDSLYFDMDKKKVFLYGEAQVNYQNVELKAAYIEFDMSNETVFATGLPDSSGTLKGNPEFSEGNEKFTSEWMRYNFKTRKGFIKKVKTNQEGGTLIGDSTKRNAMGHIHLKGATYSTCDLDHPHFYVGLTKAKSVPGDKVVSGPAYFVVADIPLPLIIPFGFFPNTNTYSSGILMPTWGEEKTRGFYLRNGGYYFGISDYADARVMLDVFSYGSWSSSTLANYKMRYKFSGNFQFNYAVNKTVDDKLNESTQKDYSLRWSHIQDPKSSPNSSFSASVNLSSSSYDKLNSYDATSYLTNQKQSSVNYSRNWPGLPFHLQASMSHNQNSRNKTVDMKLPGLSFNTDAIYPFRKEESSGKMKWYENVQLSYNANMENNIHTYDSIFLKKEMFDNMGNGFKHEIRPSVSFKLSRFITLTPGLNYEGMLYTEKLKWSSDTLHSNTGLKDGVRVDTIKGFTYAHAYFPSVSLGYNPKLYGMYMVRNSKVKAIRHVMSPSATFSYTPDISKFSPDYDQDVVKKDGTTASYSSFQGMVYGGPRQSRIQSASINFGLRNNLEMKYRSSKDTTGKDEKISLLDNLDFSSSYDLMKDSNNLDDIRMNTGTGLFGDKLNIQFNATFDPYSCTKKGAQLKEWQWQKNKQLARLTQASLSLGTSFSSSEIKGKGKDGAKESTVNKDVDPNNLDAGKNEDFVSDEINYDIPWSLRVDYSWSYSKVGDTKTIMQSANFSGDLSITKKWKIGFRSGYDFTNKDITFTSVNINRDLHCWQMTFNWVPFGYRSSYNFTINAKASILKDLKYNKRNDWRDKF